MPGPDPSPGDDAESRKDSASSLQGPDTYPEQRDLDGGDHAHPEAELDFHARLARDHYSFSIREGSVPRTCPSVTSSMDIARGSRATSSLRSSVHSSSLAHPPSLADTLSTLTSSSVASHKANSAVKIGPLDEEGNQVGGPVYALRCLFDFLACPQTFDSDAEWYEHSKVHLRSCPPPKELLCAFRLCAWQSDKTDGEAAWQDRWNHFCEDHNVFAECHVPWRRDPALFQHLWNMGLVDSVQFQELRVHGQLSFETSNYTLTEGQARQRRREGRPAGTGAGYGPRTR